jgi:methylmalonyl-CoA/ethylmalonyl-CoA epimerase
MTDRRPTGRVEGVHHVAFAHDAASPVLDALRELLDLEVAHVEPGAGFIERMLPTGDGCHVQLLEACGPGVVDKFIERRGPALHHLAFAVIGLDELLAELKDRGVRLVDETPRLGGMGTRVAFIHPSVFGGLLVELVEEPGPP